MKLHSLLRAGVLGVAMLGNALSEETRSLKEAFADHFLVGTAVNRSIVSGEPGFRRGSDLVAKDIALVKAQFNQIVAENDMKWMMLHPRPGEEGYDFTASDALVEFGEAPGWMKSIIETYDGNPYKHLVKMGKRAQQDGVIKGILLHQGESNTNDKDWPVKVKAIYEDLLRELDLKAEEVPLLAGELVSEDQGGACANMNAIIRKLPDVIPTAYVVSSKGCESREDHLHFTPAGYRELGKHYAETIWSLLKSQSDDHR